MGIVNYTYNRSTSGGEIITHLINATDGEGLHLDGTAGYVDIPTVPDLGTKFSFEFILQADSYSLTNTVRIIDFGNGGRFLLGWYNAADNNLQIHSVASWSSFGVKVLDDLKVHHLVVTIDGTSAILYDNGNQVGTATITSPDIDSCTEARIGSEYNSATQFFNGTLYRTRFWNKTLTAAEVTASYENATVPFADQYGSQTNKVAATADQTWATAQADTGNDANDRATFNAAYVWAMAESPTDISVASNTLTFSTAGASAGIYYPSVLTAGKTFRTTINVGSVTGSAAFKVQYHTGSAYVDVHTLVAGSNIVEFTPSVTNGNFFIVSTSASAGTLALNATSISNELVAAGVVSDYDLAFANPTQSLLVQDRAGAADGTASATGVAQVTPIEQLNSKSARIGTSAATPADGDLIVSGNIGIGTLTPNVNSGYAGLTLNGTTGGEIDFEDDGVLIGTVYNDANDLKLYAYASRNLSFTAGAVELMRIDSAGVTTLKSPTGAQQTANLTFNSTNYGSYGSTYAVNSKITSRNVSNSDAYSSDMAFHTNATDGTLTERMRIDSAGNVGIGVTPTEMLTIAKSSSGGSGGGIVVSNTYASNPATGGFIDLMERGTEFGASGNYGFRFLYNGSTNDLLIKSCDQTSVATHLTMARDSGLATFTNPGWPLKNELTNSAFSVWSNSTLEDVATIAEDDCASDDTGDWITVYSALAFDTDHYNYTTTGTNSTVQLGVVSPLPVVTGKLYELSCDVKNGAGSTTTLKLHSAFSGTVIRSPEIATTASFVTHTFTVECPTGTTASVGLSDATNFASNIEIKNFSFKEVTPGITAATSSSLAFDGWKKDSDAGSGLDIYRDQTTTYTKDGSFYSLKVIKHTAATEKVFWPGGTYGNTELIQRFAGRTVTMGCWAYSVSAADNVRLGFSDGSWHYSSTFAAADTWTWLEYTYTISASATSFLAAIVFDGDDNDNAYISQPMLCFSSAIGSGNYSAPSGEIVWFEKSVLANSVNNATISSTTQYVATADSNGAIPKGAKQIYCQLEGKCATANKVLYQWQASGVPSQQLEVRSQVSNVWTNANGFLPVADGGDFHLARDDTFSAYLQFKGVQLR